MIEVSSMFFKKCVCVSNIVPGFANGMQCLYKKTKDGVLVRKPDETKEHFFTLKQFGEIFKV